MQISPWLTAVAVVAVLAVPFGPVWGMLESAVYNRTGRIVALLLALILALSVGAMHSYLTTPLRG